MNIILFRHGERAGLKLSPYGHVQAKKLSLMVQSKTLQAPDLIYCSEQTRTQETMNPLAKQLSIEICISADLNERQEDETSDSNDFKSRIQKALDFFVSLNKTVFVCTHIDSLKEALSLLPSDKDFSNVGFSELVPGCYYAFEIKNGLWEFRKSGVL